MNYRSVDLKYICFSIRHDSYKNVDPLRNIFLYNSGYSFQGLLTIINKIGQDIHYYGFDDLFLNPPILK